MFVVLTVVDLQHGHVAQEIDGAHLHPHHVQAGTFLEVGHKFFFPVLVYQRNTVVLHQFARHHLDAALTYPHAQHNEQVGECQFRQGHGRCQGVDHREAYHHKEIGHLSHGHGIGTVAHDAEDTEHADAHTDARLAFHVLEHENHEEHDEEDGHTDEHEGEIEVAPMALVVIEQVHHHPIGEQAYQEPHYHVQIVGRNDIKQGFHHDSFY